MRVAVASPSYHRSRERLAAYFGDTAHAQWAALTSDAPVSRVRQTVRAGRQAMRDLLLSWLPADLSGRRLLDAGCGTGALAVEAAQRGAEVVAIDLAPGLVDVARARAPVGLSIDWRVGDMTDPALGSFDHVVAMDSLIHYAPADVAAALAAVAPRTRHSILFTFAPASPLLRAMWWMGKAFPRADRAPAIVPVDAAALAARLGDALPAFAATRQQRVARGFYTSEAMALTAGGGR